MTVRGIETGETTAGLVHVDPVHSQVPNGVGGQYYDLWQGAVWAGIVIGLLNLLPLWPLDGGHILLALLQAVRRRAISARRSSRRSSSVSTPS